MLHIGIFSKLSSARKSSQLIAMLRHFCLSRHLIILPPPPPRKVDFSGGGGVAVLGYFHQFLSLGDKKIFGKNLGQAGTFEMFFGQVSAIFGQITAIEISKIWDFGHFWPNLGKFWRLFFFKMRFWSKTALKWLKMILDTFFGSQRWFYAL